MVTHSLFYCCEADEYWRGVDDSHPIENVQCSVQPAASRSSVGEPCVCPSPLALGAPWLLLRSPSFPTHCRPARGETALCVPVTGGGRCAVAITTLAFLPATLSAGAWWDCLEGGCRRWRAAVTTTLALPPHCRRAVVTALWVVAVARRAVATPRSLARKWRETTR